MIIKTNFEKSSEIGVYCKLTNNYCIIPYDAPIKFYKLLQLELNPSTVLIRGTISGSRCIGRMVIGNNKGLILPSQTTVEEFTNIRNLVPDQVIVARSSEKFSALGNCISVNDFSALISPEISNETEELLQDVLGVEVFRITLAKEKLIGSYCLFNNRGGLVHSNVSSEEQDELSSLLRIPFLTGTVNRGSNLLGCGILTNDLITFCGFRTTQAELFVIDMGLKTSTKK
mmetsp:Transcript_55526/g.130036  ORF Transcript_55526/g.130036 Transcript_55526/m.130036 type:complete len:229 (-) Transcript_55526:127-813(-)